MYFRERVTLPGRRFPSRRSDPNDALVRPTAVATCTTDVHAIATLAFPNALGKVIGHEAVGVSASTPFDRDSLPGLGERSLRLRQRNRP